MNESTKVLALITMLLVKKHKPATWPIIPMKVLRDKAKDFGFDIEQDHLDISAKGSLCKYVPAGNAKGTGWQMTGRGMKEYRQHLIDKAKAANDK